jgi:hypothetical protein
MLLFRIDDAFGTLVQRATACQFVQSVHVKIRHAPNRKIRRHVNNSLEYGAQYGDL